MSCTFDIAWVGPCKAPAQPGTTLCAQHTGVRCVVCMEQAAGQCSYAGQFVCGAPLCAKCEGWEDMSKASGNWGFLNHSHRRRLTCEPVRRDARGKPIVSVRGVLA